MPINQITALLSYLDSQPEPRIVMDKAYNIIAANKAYRAAHDDSIPLVGRHCYEVSHHYTRPCDEEGESCPLKLSMVTGLPQRVLHLTICLVWLGVSRLQRPPCYCWESPAQEKSW